MFAPYARKDNVCRFHVAREATDCAEDCGEEADFVHPMADAEELCRLLVQIVAGSTPGTKLVSLYF
jgi:hypothetical protein